MFPFDLPAATSTYVVLYVLTFAVHLVLMSYVLAGSGYLAVATALGRGGRSPIAALLRDWLPFGLGAAITAGVAPLLFLQILYKESFYTANLLLFHRFMAMVPVLMIGFYLLYLHKSRETWPKRARIAIAGASFLCFAFTAYTFTENHLLALDHGAWVDFYASGKIVYRSDQIAPRVAVWLSGAVPILCVILGWQLRHEHRKGGPGAGRLAAVAVSGLLVHALCALLYLRGVDELMTRALAASSLKPYLAAIVIGLAAQAVVWVHVWRAGRMTTRGLVAATIGAGLAVIGVAAVREAMRLSMFEIDGLRVLHERAAAAGGRWAFVLFLFVNIGAIAWCFAMTKRGLDRGPSR